ncbi:hypothetical protein HPB50_001931 [Hyalomma asiaticum]|uniref:Uncharacterized protein n=1 Tax=Hyalomma asiaticum TaxID=266040 RepID=A0ACB7TBB1_HYAAI|nr:hypothetical protein HPB50_001931 [Hyalomma asiaticum]
MLQRLSLIKAPRGQRDRRKSRGAGGVPASKLRPTDSGGARASGPSSASRCPGSCHRRHRQQRRITCTLVIVHVFGAVRSGNRGHVPLRGRPGRCVTGGDSRRRRRRHASTGGVIRNARALTADDEAAETNRRERRPPQPHKSDSLFLNARRQAALLKRAEGTDLSTALGFTDSDSCATSDMVDVVSTSKERLRKWWLETRR